MKKADYAARGARAYEIGVIYFAITAPRGWQQSAEREGYTKARDAWRAANPDVDEWDAARARALEIADRVIGAPA